MCRILVDYPFIYVKVKILLEVEEARVFLDSTVVHENNSLILVGIPAFNEERSISKIVCEAQKFADVVVVCDDGSRDQTAAIAKSLGADVVKHRRNLGYGAAIQSLFRRARKLNADVLVTIDSDGQHDPKEIPNVVKPIVQGTADLVIGSRFINCQGTGEMPLYRWFGAKLITKLVNGSSKNGIKDAQSGFRAYGRKALTRLSISEAGMGASVEILLKSRKQNLRICEVPSSCKYNNGDVATSSEHPVKHGIGVIMSIIRITIKERPIMALGISGALCLFAGILFGVWKLQLYAVEHQIVTNIALASIAFVLLGFFILSTAIILHAISRLSKKMNGCK